MERDVFELEKRITYLERYVDDLNEVVIEQGKAIKRLIAELNGLKEKSQMSPVDPVRPAYEKPPHY
ncbi:MAG: hypothetical protein Kow0029_21800 [Candidatus Rifleibacteriota bacterium]